MGESNVFTLETNKFCGIGISYERFNGVPNINISLPFVMLSIYFRKSKDNKWF